MRGIYVLLVEFKDGTSRALTRIDRDDPDWSALLDEATAHYERHYAGRGTLSFHYAARLAAMPVPNAASLRPWRELRAAAIAEVRPNPPGEPT